MSVQKMPVEVPFGQGLDTKTDKTSVAPGKFLVLENGEFNNNGQLQKRKGFARKSQLPNLLSTNLRTLNSNLIATGTELYTYSEDTNQWLDAGIVQPVDLKTEALVRTSTSQKQPGAAVAYNGLVALVYNDNGSPFYQVNDKATTQQIVAQTAFPSGAKDPQVYVLGSHIMFLYKVNVTGNIHLRYIAMSVANPTVVSAPVDLAVSLSSINASYDGVILDDKLYVVYDSGLGGGSVRLRFIDSTLVQSSEQAIAAHTASKTSIAASGSSVAVTFYQTSNTTIYVATFSANLGAILAPIVVTAAVDVARLTSVYNGTTLHIMYEIVGAYSYDSGIRTDHIDLKTVTQSGTVSSATTIVRGAGLASKSFLGADSLVYVLIFYGQTYQPSYFLINESGNVLSRLAYSNGITYADGTIFLPSVHVSGSSASIPYLIKDLLVSVNKTQGAPNVAGIYSQTGVNLATFMINDNQQYASEIAGSLHLTGGQVWQYDSVKPVELGFHVWPEDVEATTSTTGGLLTAQTYFYQFCYEWTDAKGNLHRSAPSVPISVVTTGSTSSNTINVPTLRLTAKIGRNLVRIVGYRWSTGQQSYYQFTPIQTPVLNDTTVDSVTIVDTLADSAILGNTLLYTTGGVLENIAPPAAVDTTLFNGRLWLIDAEDRNTLWYSKIVLQGTPVEMTDFQTLYVAPNSSAQGSSGAMTAIAAMDDKLIIFKESALYYVTGSGPDATGANGQYSDPIFITGAVGCANPNSITLTPNGIMFQSDKGIWLLARNLATSYIGADVEAFNSDVVVSALTIPGTNQVRFQLESGLILMFDYYYSQWGVFRGAPGISACLYQDSHTILNSYGFILQQNDKYLDDTSPVLFSFKTAWIRLTGLQGYQRAYFLYMLSNYMTPHKLAISVSYDYASAPEQTAIIIPTNYSPVYGADTYYGGGSPYGGQNDIEQWRIFFTKQKCQAVQISVVETYDPTKGAAAGAGLSFSGFTLVLGAKKGYTTVSSKQSVS